MEVFTWAQLCLVASHRCWSQFVFNSWVLCPPTAPMTLTVREVDGDKFPGDPDLLCGPWVELLGCE